MPVHVLQTLVLYECEKHGREEEWEEANEISCEQVLNLDNTVIGILNFFNFVISFSGQ